MGKGLISRRSSAIDLPNWKPRWRLSLVEQEWRSGTMSYFLMLFLAISVAVLGICHPSLAANSGASSPLESNYLSPSPMEAVNDASLVATVGPKTRGAAVLRAQILLDSANFCLLYTSPSPRDGLLSR